MFKKKKDQTYQSYWSISWNIFKKNKVAMVCLFIVILLCLIALFAPLIAPYDPNKQVLTCIDVFHLFKTHNIPTDKSGC